VSQASSKYVLMMMIKYEDIVDVLECYTFIVLLLNPSHKIFTRL